ncbi:hypothetical protein N6Q81_30655, partial [Streptomyces vinaceusdrappus]
TASYTQEHIYERYCIVHYEYFYFRDVYKSQGSHRGVPIGRGPWDRSGRDSWVDVDRVLRLYDAGMPREACALDRMRFDLVRRRLRERYGWS